jgi:hypothetical protein
MRKVGFEVWFGFWFVVFAVRYPLPEIRDEVPKNFQRTDAFDRQRVLIGRTTAASRNTLAIEIEFRGRYSELANLVFSGKLPSMEAEIDCKLQSNSR